MHKKLERNLLLTIIFYKIINLNEKFITKNHIRTECHKKFFINNNNKTEL